MLVDFAAETRHDRPALLVQLRAAFGEGEDRREIAMHIAGDQITVDTLEQSFNKLIAALRDIENGS